ncbi:MAG: extracellular solute-binding protein [Gammaproteobacteria bacterium]|nr:extracellular solute-binding protein [Gammaproteobacteria bacterium]MBU1777037.1 extracellular solute-binding protein [Gammaproteobacteria bacterium]
MILYQTLRPALHALRRLMPRIAALALLSAMAAPVWAAAPVLRVLAWPGYADPAVVKSFEQQHGVRVEVTVIDSDSTLWHKISADDAAYDVFAVNAAELQRYIALNLLQTADPARIPNTARQLPRFRNLASIPGLVHQGHAYGIPYTYSEMGLIYDKRQISSPPQSIAALWDPRYRGKVLAYDGGTHNFSLAAQTLKTASPFRLARADWPRAVDRLIDMRRNVLGFYSQPEESVRLFMRHGAALMFANYGMQQVHLLKAAGADIGYAIPREGALTWLDCWTITRRARDPALAHAWIDHLLGDQASALLVKEQGLANTIAESDASHGDNRLLWLEPVEDAELRDRLWQRIRSGDRAAKVLAP